jgi:hypothetical protein
MRMLRRFMVFLPLEDVKTGPPGGGYLRSASYLVVSAGHLVSCVHFFERAESPLQRREVLPKVRRAMTGYGRFCCKTLFALLMENSPGCRRGFRVDM